MRGRYCRTGSQAETGHLFLCRRCRTEARLATAWKKLPRPTGLEMPEPASEEFLRRLAAAVSKDRRRRLRRRTLLSMVAALLFFFLAGAGHESRAVDAGRAEDSYAQLLAPSALESLLPD